MIKITIQGKNQEEKQLGWANGEKSGENYYEICNFMEKYNFIRNGIEEAKFTNEVNMAYIFHPEKDDIGRTRVAMLVWDKDSDQSEIQKTIELAGLDYERFLLICNEAKVKKSKQNNKNVKNIFIGGGAGLLVGVAAECSVATTLALCVVGGIIGYGVTKIKG